MTKKDNLYSEVVINESPFYYDNHGRLRVHVLNEASYVSTADMRMDPVTGKAGPSKTVKISDDTPPTPPKSGKDKPKRTLGGLFGKIKNKQGLGPIPAKGAGDDDGMGMVYAGGGSKERGSSHNRINAPKTETKPVPAKGNDDGGGVVKPAVQPFGKNDDGGKMRTADMQDRDLDGTDDRDQTPSKPAPAPIQSVKGPGRNMNTRKGLRGVGDLRARGAELKKRGDNLRGRIAALKDQKREMKAAGQKPGADLKNKIRGLKDKLGKGQRRGGLAPRSMQESILATDYLLEKINMKKAKMGDVIKDFQESDAPQFQGKSKEKRRQMAIAAKLSADRG